MFLTELSSLHLSLYYSSWSCIDNGFSLLWSGRSYFTLYPRNVDPTLIPSLGDQSIYINWKNNVHFEACHTGLSER